MNHRLTIGKLAKLSGIPPKTIRYYEGAGILPEPKRSESGYRLYSEIDLHRAQLVRRARLLAMSLPEVRELLEWAGSETCENFQVRFLEAVRRKLKEADSRIADLEHLRQDLQRLEAHLMESANEVNAGHTVLECSPETCTCLGGRPEASQTHEVELWLSRSG